MEGFSKHEDREVENIFSDKIENNIADPSDKPLSPVLISSNLNRKHLFGRNRIHRRSRIRLTERFEDCEASSRQNNKTVHQNHQSFSEEDFTLSQTVNELSCSDRLEEIQKNRKEAYKLIVSSKNADFLFKKPISPAPKKLKGSHSASENIFSEYKCSDTNVIEDEEHDKFMSAHKQPTDFQICTGFQTATGRAVSISESDIKKHESLFADILTPSQNVSNGRKNKYNFLRRGITNNSIRKNANTESSANSSDSSISDSHENISLTQEISDSGVSNTQMLSVAEVLLNDLGVEKMHNNEVFNDETIEFKGFNEFEIVESSRAIDSFNNILSHKISMKRSFSSSEGDYCQQKKKIKQDIPDQSVSCFNKLKKGNNNGGFSFPSGKATSTTFAQKENSKHNSKLISHGTQENDAIDNIQSSENRCKTNSSLKSKLKFFDDLIGDTECDITGLQTSDNLGFSKASENISPSIPGRVSSADTQNKQPLNGVKDKLAFFDRMLDNTEFDSMPIPAKNKLGFSTASERKVLSTIQYPEPAKSTTISAQSVCKNKLKMLDNAIGRAETNNNMCPLPVGTGFSTASGKSFKLSETVLNKASALFDDLKVESPQKPFSVSNQQRGDRYDTPKRKTSLIESLSAKRSSRKLGITSCKPIAISAEKLNSAKRMFEEEFGSVSPIRPIQCISNTSTPLQKHSLGDPILKVASKSESLTVSGVTDEKNQCNYKLAEDSAVTYVDPENKFDLDAASELETERERLEERLGIIIRRQEALVSLKVPKSEVYRKPRPGKLLEQKARNGRIAIANLVHGHEHDGNCDLFFITPQNAENIHFKESSSVLLTEDGATVIPNSKDLIGLKEIEQGIKTMPYVEESLIPKNWIRNHYKWIVWKLASYERMFPSIFKGYLNVESVVQQLKYRYDREVDKAERPALRRICEKDDSAQKRIILCVSDIKEVDFSRFEFQLTDGWYSIRTVIDDPLCNQVRNKKIKIGTKLVIWGAELMNCDGCSPLEITDQTHLKINFNSTRRAIWYARLGYQSFPGPFTIQIRTVLPNGGPIGAIEICIARIYPVKYLEKTNGRSVWRNKRSEERSAQAWEMDQSRRMEEIEENIRREFSEVKTLTGSKKTMGARDISDIENPELLMEIIESSNDPESIQEKLSCSQKSAVFEYRQNSFARKLEEMSEKAKEDIERLKVAKRDVVPVLKMLVVDTNGSPTRAFSFFVWRPSESHFQVLREGACFTACNVLPRMNGDLGAGSKTLFLQSKQKNQMSEIFNRKLVEISEISDAKFSTNFSEFDTVGMVVGMKIEENRQEIWLTDISGRLLLVEIDEGPSTCLSLDKLKRGQSTSVCNLTYKGSKLDFAKSSANHFAIFSSYSQYRHLQEGLDRFQKTLPRDCDGLLQECDRKIEAYKMSPNISKNVSQSSEESYDEDTLVPSRITSTDLALSLIDIDKLS